MLASAGSPTVTGWPAACFSWAPKASISASLWRSEFTFTRDSLQPRGVARQNQDGKRRVRRARWARLTQQPFGDRARGGTPASVGPMVSHAARLGHALTDAQERAAHGRQRLCSWGKGQGRRTTRPWAPCPHPSSAPPEADFASLGAPLLPAPHHWPGWSTRRGEGAPRQAARGPLHPRRPPPASRPPPPSSTSAAVLAEAGPLCKPLPAVALLLLSSSYTLLTQEIKDTHLS